jgi:hypothetical protein
VRHRPDDAWRRRPNGGGCTTWNGDIGHTMRKGGSGRMTGRGQQHAAPGRAGSRAPSASCLASPAAEHYASKAVRWPSVIAHERLPSGLTCLRAAESSPLRGAHAAELSYLHAVAHAARWPRVVMHERLPSGLTCLRVDVSSPLRRPHAAGAFLPLRRHVAAHWHTADHWCSLLCVGCAQRRSLGREKGGKEANGLDR